MTVALQDRVRPIPRVSGDYCVCALPFPALRTVEVIGGPFSRTRSASHPRAELPRVDQGPVPGPPPLLGARGRHRRRRDGHRSADPPHELPAVAIRRTSAACCSPRTPGARTRCSGAPWIRRRGSKRRSTTWRESTRASARSTRSGKLRLVRRPLGARRVRAVRAGPADRPAGGDRRARRTRALRRRALLAVPRVDPGSAGVAASARRRRSTKRSDPTERRAVRPVAARST